MLKGRHFLADVIVVCVRWYLEYKLSSRDVSRLMAAREISVDHSTILRWVRRYAPEFEKKWHRYAHLIGPSWRVDETYVKVGGAWTYLYRGVDKSGKSTVSHRISAANARSARRRPICVSDASAYAKAAYRHAGRLRRLAPGRSGILRASAGAADHDPLVQVFE
jgi:hypothetical protein